VARIIGEAAVRISFDTRGSATQARVAGEKVGREFAKGANNPQGASFIQFNEADFLPKAEKAGDDAGKSFGEKMLARLKNIDLGALLGSAFASLGNLVQGSVGLTLLGAKAGIALAAITNLTTGVAGLLSALGTLAGGAAAAAPAVLATLAAVSLTLKVGLSGVGDSLKALTSGDLEKFQQSLTTLAPEARAAVSEFAKFKPQLDGIRSSTQNDLFLGLSKPLGTLLTNFLPQTNALFNGIALSLNSAARETLGFLNSTSGVGQVQQLFGNIRGTVAGLAPAVSPFLEALLRVASVGSSFLPGLAEQLGGVSQRFAAFIDNANESGALQNFFGKAIGVASQLGSILHDLFSSLSSVFGLASQAGGGVLNNLQAMVTALHAFTSSGSGQAAILGFFESMRTITASLMPVFTTLAGVIGTTVAPILARLASIIGPALTPLIQGLGTALQAASPGLAAIATGVAALFTAAGPALTALGRLAGVIGQSLGAVLERLAPVLNDVVTALADALTQALSDPAIVDGLVAVGQALGDMVIALAPLLPQLAKLAGPLLDLLVQALDAVKPLLGPLVGLFGSLVDIVVALLPILEPLIPLIELVAKALGLVAVVAEKVVEALAFLINKVKELFGFIGDLVGAAVDLITGNFDTAGQLTSNLSDKFGEMSGRIDTSVGNATTSILQFTDNVTKNLEVFSGALGGALGDGALAADHFQDRFTSALQNFSGSVGANLGSVLQQTDDFQRRFTISMAEFSGSLGGAAGSAVDFSTRTGSAFSAAADQVQASINRILGITNAAVGPLGAAGSAAGSNYAAGVGAGGGLASTQAHSIVDNLTAIFGDTTRFGAAGSALVGAFSDGMSRSAAAAKATAARIMANVAALFPSSPAKEGPFSGTGWTPFRGAALVDGFAGGILSRLTAARDAAAQVAAAVADPLSQAVPTSTTAGTSATSAAGTGQQVTINQTNVMLPGTDVQQFASEVNRRGALALSAGPVSLPTSQGSVQSGMAAPNTLIGV
jgi:phage-related protein